MSTATTRTPRYAQMADELRAAILAGDFADGRSFPTETTLCDRYAVSRFTVREALKRLQSEGLIARKRGSGTIVQPASARGGALHQPLSNVGELLQYAAGSAIRYRPAGKGPFPAEIAEQIGCDTSGNWHRFHGVRRPESGGSEALPIAATDAWFHERIGDAVPELDLSAGTLFSQIEQLTDTAIGQVTQDIQAIAADAETARALEMKRGAPVLRIIRCYRDPQGRVFEISVSHHPGDRFAYAMHIDLDG